MFGIPFLLSKNLSCTKQLCNVSSCDVKYNGYDCEIIPEYDRCYIVDVLLVFYQPDNDPIFHNILINIGHDENYGHEICISSYQFGSVYQCYYCPFTSEQDNIIRLDDPVLWVSYSYIIFAIMLFIFSLFGLFIVYFKNKNKDKYNLI